MKYFIRKKKTGIVNVFLLLTIFSYHRFQEIELANINPFDFLWKNKIQILNNYIVPRLCKWKEPDTQITKTANNPKFTYKFVIFIYFLGG